jgi:hypothetical protein
MVHGVRGLACLAAMACSGMTGAAEPVRVFILAGQSNMEGQAVVDLEGKDYNQGRGTLKALFREPELAKRLAHLRGKDGNWAVRDDVVVWYQPEKMPLKKGPLGFGFTPYGDKHHFGPELQFGHVVGDHFREPVLLVKCAWGGKSLYKDFRPPSSGGETGPYYQRMVADVRQAMSQFKIHFPAFADREPVLSGLVWYHGWNDGVDPKTAIPQYEDNLVHLIQDVRKDLQAPELPVVIGELTGAWVKAPPEWEKLRQAQANAAKRPEVGKRVAFVSTREFVRKPEDSPNPGHGHHEFGNAETYFLVGDALGKAMVQLLDQGPGKNGKAEASKPTTRTERQVEGWTVRVDDRLLRPENRELADKALRFLAFRLAELKVVVPVDKVARLQRVPIVLDQSHGGLVPMQYHPSADWLRKNGYSEDLAKCVHLPRAADLMTARNIREQPWVILHELSHAYHDQVLGFDNPRVAQAYEDFKKSGHGDKALLHDGKRVKHYGLTTPMEFFAEMSEAYFGSNDFFPFNRAELKENEPAIYQLLRDVWEGK